MWRTVCQFKEMQVQLLVEPVPLILDELVFHSRKNRILNTSRNIWRLPKKIKKIKNFIFYKKRRVKCLYTPWTLGVVALTPMNFYFSQFRNFSTVKRRAPPYILANLVHKLWYCNNKTHKHLCCWIWPLHFHSFLTIWCKKRLNWPHTKKKVLLVQYESFCTKLAKEKIKGIYLLQDQSLCTKLAKIKVQGVHVQPPQSLGGVRTFFPPKRQRRTCHLHQTTYSE